MMNIMPDQPPMGLQAMGPMGPLATTHLTSMEALSKDTLPAEPLKAAKQMEGYFASMLVSELRKGLPSGSWFGGGTGTDVYDGLFDQMLGESLSDGLGLGLKDSIAVQLAERAARTEASSEAQKVQT